MRALTSYNKATQFKLDKRDIICRADKIELKTHRI